MPRDVSAETEPLPITELCHRHEGDWLLIKILDSSLPMGDAPGLVLARG